MSSMDYFPLLDAAEVEMYKQLKRKILADQAKQQKACRDENMDLKSALVELDDDASMEKPRRKWHRLSFGKYRSAGRESDRQTIIYEEPYSYQGTRGYGKLAAQRGQ